MGSLADRDNKRKSVVSSMISGADSKKPKPETERVQKSYYFDKDIFKALKMKSLQEDKNLTEAINEALREGLKDYL